MKIGIYNRWLSTAGGGERYMLTAAMFLAQRHDVDVLTHRKVAPAELERKLNIDLSNVSIRYLPDVPEEELTECTKDYDLFINSTFMSTLRSKAKKSILFIYFPIPKKEPYKRLLGRTVRYIAERTMAYELYNSGFYAPERIGNREFRWMGRDGGIDLNFPFPVTDPRVTLLLGRAFSEDVGPTQVSVSFRGQELAEFEVPCTGGSLNSYQLTLPGTHRDGVRLNLKTSNTHTPPNTTDSRRLGISVFGVKVQHPANFPYRVVRRLSPGTASRITRRRPSASCEFLNTYSQLVTISKFSHHWLNEYWDKDSTILYPPVDTDSFQPGEKKNIILSVGRFFRGSHNKKHDVLARTFCEMVDEGLQGWELHLAGGVPVESEHRRYYKHVEKISNGYPVVFHPNVPFPVLKDLYASARIYWHGCGHGENEQAAPIRFEHFGITTVEAMSAGCIPVVIGKAGQRETVEHGTSGMLWTTTEQLKSHTLSLIHQPDRVAQFGQNAITRSDYFSAHAFGERLFDIIDQCCEPDQESPSGQPERLCA